MIESLRSDLMIEEVKGGHNIYGEAIGIITLETIFPRIRGDIGNALTWDFPVIYKIVKGSVPSEVVRKGIKPIWLKRYIEAAQELEQTGVKAITTSCGFLGLFQEEIANSVNIPVFTSSLMQIPLIYRMLKKDQKIGIITVNSQDLTKKHLDNVGAGLVPTIIVGTENEEEFTKVFLGNKIILNVERAKSDLIKVGKKLVSQYHEIGAIVLECTNMPPFAKSIQQEVNLPIFDIYTLTNMVYGAVARKGFFSNY